MEITKEKIASLVRNIFPDLVEIRRHLHANPELSFKEYNTSAYICSVLDKWGVPYKLGIAGTGIVANIEVNGKGRIMGFRADMDALPIREKNDIEYKSVNEGVMHACGHDLHSASMLGLVKVLMELKEHFKGLVRVVFQPGEEKIPGGAKLMLEDDLFGDMQPEIMIAQHVYPELETGFIGIRPGMYMASSDEIYITIQGKGGHAALPHYLIDPVVVTSHVILALQQIAGRNAPSHIPTVLSFGRIIGEGAVNVIPDSVSIEGTFRTMDEEWRKKAHERITEVAQKTAEGMGAKAIIEIRKGYPVLFNNPELTQTFRSFASGYIGANNIVDLEPRMTAEDFAYFSQKYPSMLFRLGTTTPGQKGAALHTPVFNVDEKAMETSVGLLAWTALNYLND